MTGWIFDAALTVTSPLNLSIVGKATIVLAFGLTALPLANRAQASLRHQLMAATFLTVLVLPFVISTVPQMTIHVPVAANAIALGNGAYSDAHGSMNSIAALLRFAWAAGAILLLGVFAIDLLRLRALKRGGLPWPEQLGLTRSLAKTIGVHRSVEVLLHESVTAPLTYGIWRPVILLPIDASDWNDADLRRALVHELEHVRRGDWATQLIARVVCVCYWFHPLVRMAWRQLCLEAERACDDAVLQCAESTEYAEQLVSLAKRLSTARALPSLAMANRSDLSARVVALLDRSKRRGRVGYATTATVVGISCALMLAIASVRAIAAPTVLPEALRVLRSAGVVVLAARPLKGGVRADDSVGSQATRANPIRHSKRLINRPTEELATDSRDSTASSVSSRPAIERSIGISFHSESTVSAMSSASGSATHSASASSSSRSSRR